MRRLVAFCLTLIFPSLCFAYAGKVVKAVGRVSIVKRGTFRGVPYWKLKGILDVGDVLRTKRKSQADVLLVDKSFIHLGQSSRLIILKIERSVGKVFIPSGKVVFKITKRVKGAFKVITPTTIVGVKGTEFLVKVFPGETLVSVRRGVVEVVNPSFPSQRVILKSGQSASVAALSPPKVKVNLNIDSLSGPYSSAEQTLESFISQNFLSGVSSNLYLNINVPQTSVEGY